MNRYCQDKDLLAIEPLLFADDDLAGQPFLRGSEAQLSGTDFHCEGVDFLAAGIEAGMVLRTYSNTPSEGHRLEIVSVTASSLTVSVLRSSAEQTPIATVLDEEETNFAIHSYDLRIRIVSEMLAEKLRRICESDLSIVEFIDSQQLRQATVYGVLSEVFIARSESGDAKDAHWLKAEYYRQRFQKLLLQLRLAVDANGDGIAEKTRSLGNVTLRRS
jgi:hypothetical protein